MSNTDLMNDPELVECAGLMAEAYGFEKSDAEHWINEAAAARDFFRERWKPGPMPTPDFSGDPERVALAKELRTVALRVSLEEMGYRNCETWDQIEPSEARYYLAMADAAISHLGSGYRLPEANEANAERLAREYTRILLGKPQNDPGWVKDATNYLRALHAAFGASDPDSPADPTFCRPGCDRKLGHLGPHSDEGADFAAEATERERRRLLEAFMRDMVGNPAVMAKMLENYEATDGDAIAAHLHEIALAFAQELIG